jgi:hypothetical protein
MGDFTKGIGHKMKTYIIYFFVLCIIIIFFIGIYKYNTIQSEIIPAGQFVSSTYFPGGYNHSNISIVETTIGKFNIKDYLVNGIKNEQCFVYKYHDSIFFYIEGHTRSFQIE